MGPISFTPWWHHPRPPCSRLVCSRGGGGVPGCFASGCMCKSGWARSNRPFFSCRYSRCRGLGAVSPTLLYALSALLVFDRSLAESVRGAACVRGVWEAVGPDVRFEWSIECCEPVVWCGPSVGALGPEHAAGPFVLCPCLYCNARIAGRCAGQFQGARGYCGEVVPPSPAAPQTFVGLGACLQEECGKRGGAC